MSDEKESLGSVAEEAVKLLGALQEWARDNGQDSAGATAGAGAAFRTLNEHIATGADDCRYCPLCQVVGVVRQTSPEVRQHLSSAASSLFRAAAAVMSTDGPGRKAQAPVEKIDLLDDGSGVD